MTSVDSNFNFLCGRPHEAGPPSPVHMRPPEPDPLPLRVDVINVWSLCSRLSLNLPFAGRHFPRIPDYYIKLAEFCAEIPLYELFIAENNSCFSKLGLLK